MIPKTKSKELLKDSGKWVLIHGIGEDRGCFKSPMIKPEAVEVFQEIVDKFAEDLAAAANLLARDADRISPDNNKILPADVELARKIFCNYSNLSAIEPIRYKPCIVCGHIHSHLNDGKYGFTCEKCGHIVVPMRMAVKEGDKDRFEGDDKKVKEEVV